jgi:uncharacterized oxidoreductase
MPAMSGADDARHNNIGGVRFIDKFEEDFSMHLSGHTILITGASTGIGLAFAVKFLELGNEVIITGRRQAVLDQAKSLHPGLHTIQSDVSDPDQIAALAVRVKEEFSTLDVLFNNAGVALTKNLRSPDSDLAGMLAEMDTNFGGVVRMTSAFIDILKANRGTIINSSSALAFVPLPAMPIYCATKAAVHSYTQSLRFQLEDAGVKVIELMPPAVRTDLTSDFPESGIKMISTEELVRRTLEFDRDSQTCWRCCAGLRPTSSTAKSGMRRKLWCQQTFQPRNGPVE